MRHQFLFFVSGQSKYDLELVLSEDKVGDVLSVADLAKQVEQLTGVPQAGQRLIHKGTRHANSNLLIQKIK